MNSHAVFVCGKYNINNGFEDNFFRQKVLLLYIGYASIQVCYVKINSSFYKFKKFLGIKINYSYQSNDNWYYY